jgi:hypothetical protein
MRFEVTCPGYGLAIDVHPDLAEVLSVGTGARPPPAAREWRLVNDPIAFSFQLLFSSPSVVVSALKRTTVPVQNETVETGETGETVFYKAFYFTQLGCGKKGEILRIFKKCYLLRHFPILEFYGRDSHSRAQPHPRLLPDSKTARGESITSAKFLPPAKPWSRPLSINHLGAVAPDHML